MGGGRLDPQILSHDAELTDPEILQLESILAADLEGGKPTGYEDGLWIAPGEDLDAVISTGQIDLDVHFACRELANPDLAADLEHRVRRAEGDLRAPLEPRDVQGVRDLQRDGGLPDNRHGLGHR